jgi:S-adenosylmethionine/arginine decarboxylase-like enzyme
MPYGKELILDLHHCDEGKFNRTELEKYFTEMCDLLDMEKCALFWWDDHGLPPEECQTEPHLKGTSAVQFIMTSNITIHTLDILKRVYLNIFSCKEFDAMEAMKFSLKYFDGAIISFHVVERV